MEEMLFGQKLKMKMAAPVPDTSSSSSSSKMPLEPEPNRFLSPLASHEDVVNNPRVFTDTLKSFHSVLGTIINPPIIGGKELDLHLLYVEVTKRGGIDKVIEEKKWREIRTAFDFPPTATSASYVLKKQYISVLQQYEHVYFFRKNLTVVTRPKPVVPIRRAVAYGGESVVPIRRAVAYGGESSSNPILVGETKEKKVSGSELGTVTGTIDGKFDQGYLVTVTVGSEIFHGVLYHPAHPEVFSPPITNNVVCNPDTPGPSRNPPPSIPRNSEQPSRRRKRKRRRDVDPTRPKSSRSAYNFFFADKHNELKALYPDREHNFTKIIGHAWNNLTDEERNVYQEIGNKDKQRYQTEMKVYQEKKSEERKNISKS